MFVVFLQGCGLGLGIGGLATFLPDSDSVKEKNRTRLKKVEFCRGLTFLMEWRIIDFLNKIFAKYQFTMNLLTCSKI